MQLFLRSFLVAAALTSADALAEELSAKSFKKIKGGKKAAFVKFLAPWWGHCKKMKPDWDALGEEYESSKKVVIGDVDCTLDKNKQLCEDEGVKGYPALKYYLPGEPEGIDYSGGRDLESLKAFAKTLGPSCSPKYYSKCTAEQKEELNAYMAMDEAQLNEQLQFKINELQTATAEHEALLKELQSRFEESNKNVEALKAANEPQMRLMRSVLKESQQKPNRAEPEMAKAEL